MTDYVRYLYDLARELGCGLRLGPNFAGMMFVEFGYVEGPHPYQSSEFTPQQAFAVGLHELGHFAHGHTQGRPPLGHLKFYFENGVLRSEAEAWAFALGHFQEREEEIDPKTRTFMHDRCIGSYYTSAQFAGKRPTRLHNGDRHYIEFTYDVPDAFFHSVRAQLRGKEATA